MTGLYGIMGEFKDVETFLDAARALRSEGYRLEAYAPFSVDDLPEALALPPNRVPLYTLLGGVTGGACAYFLQWYSAVVDYPLNLGGRPLHAWPAFIPPTFELTILGAALAAFFGFLLSNGLPQLRHPIFDAPDFDLASRDRFFICVLEPDDRSRASRRLDDAGALKVVEVPG